MRKVLSLAMASFLVGFLGMASLTGCGGDDGGDTPAGGSGDMTEASGSITVYAGRKGNVVEPIIEKFKNATGIEVTVVQDKSGANLLSKIEAENEAGKPVADVLWVTDPAALGAAAAGGHLEALPASITDMAPKGWRAKDGTWVGVSGRTRRGNNSLAADIPRLLFTDIDVTLHCGFTGPRVGGWYITLGLG